MQQSQILPPNQWPSISPPAGSQHFEGGWDPLSLFDSSFRHIAELIKKERKETRSWYVV